MINNLLNRRTKAKINITKLNYNDKFVTNPTEIVESFNNFFCNISQRLKNENQSLTAGYSGRPPELTINSSQRNYMSMRDTECTVLEIEKHISSLKNKATSDLAIEPLKYVNNE